MIKPGNVNLETFNKTYNVSRLIPGNHNVSWHSLHALS